jgi:hypothetical protein
LKARHKKKKPGSFGDPGFIDPATTYYRASYTSTTIGEAAFHGRVRNENGWGNCSMVTGKIVLKRTVGFSDNDI